MEANNQINCEVLQESFEALPNPSPTHVALQRINTVSMIHDEKCFCCGSASSPDSRLIKCSFCPMAYHYECLPTGTVITTPRWGCPSHKCAVCAAPSSKSKGRMFRCVFCPTAYCLAHVSQTCRRIEENPYEDSGYNCSTFKFIVCDHCEGRNDEYFLKRKHSLHETGSSDDTETRPLKRSRTDSYTSAGSAEERAASYVSSPSDSPSIGRARQKPDEELVQIFKEVIGSKYRLQKQLADEIGISQPILSQFLNSATRNNGWRLLEEKLRGWWDLKKQEVEEYQAQRKVARLSNDSAKGHIKSERRNRAVRTAAYHYADGNGSGSIESHSSNEYSNGDHFGSSDSYASGESEYSPRGRSPMNHVTASKADSQAKIEVKPQQYGYNPEPASAPQYSFMYSYQTSDTYPALLPYRKFNANPLPDHIQQAHPNSIPLQSYAMSYEHANNANAGTNHGQMNSHHNNAQAQQNQSAYMMLDYNNYWATEVFPQQPYH